MLSVVANYTVLFKIVQVITHAVLQNVMEPQLTSSFINLFSITTFNFIAIKSSEFTTRAIPLQFAVATNLNSTMKFKMMEWSNRAAKYRRTTKNQSPVQRTKQP